MRPRNIQDEAAQKRQIAADLLRSANELDLVAAFWNSPAGEVVRGVLQQDVNLWQHAGSWRPLDDEAKREQGRALRSKELLGYFSGAQEQAEAQRAESARLTALIETAADQGRIPRV